MLRAVHTPGRRVAPAAHVSLVCSINSTDILSKGRAEGAKNMPGTRKLMQHPYHSVPNGHNASHWRPSGCLIGRLPEEA